jgi:hypothetical protein
MQRRRPTLRLERRLIKKSQCLVEQGGPRLSVSPGKAKLRPANV